MNQTNNPKSRSTPASKSTPQKKPQKNQVSLAGVAKTPKNKQKSEDKGKFPWKLVIVAVVLILLFVAGILLYGWIRSRMDKETNDKLSLTAREMVEYTYTPDKLAGDVSYYLMGVTGAEIGDPMDMLAVMCYDRKAGEVSVVQIPIDTFIDKTSGYAVDTIGDVWYNPQPEIFCSACRERVPVEARDGERHVTCGANLEERTGSATGDLIRVINDQYGLPIDNYFIVSRTGLVDLIDGFGGVEVALDKDVTLAGKVYDAGVHTLDGQAAVEYAVLYNYDSNSTSDRERMLRQRQVLASLWNNMSAFSPKELYYVDDLGATKGILGRLMVGENPIRFNSTSFGRARMLGVEDKEAEEIESFDALSRFVVQLGDIPLNKVTFSILPGGEETRGSGSIYSVNRDQVIQLLNEQMNPYGFTLDEITVTAPQVTEVTIDADFVTVTLDAMLAVAEEEE